MEQLKLLLIEEKALNSHAKEIINALLNSGCEVRADKKVNKLFKWKIKKSYRKRLEDRISGCNYFNQGS